jgi:hypothetical protein
MSHLNLKGFDEFGESLFSEQLQSNIISFFNWGLLQKGAFTNIFIPTFGAFGGSKHRLRPITEDPNVEPGMAWEGFRHDWVWERNIDYHTQPIAISGVRVNDVFYPIDTVGSYAHHIDYPLGQIVFDNPIPTNSVVTAEFSIRYFHFTMANVPWFREFLYNSYRVDNLHFQSEGSGAYATLTKNRVILPAVVVEMVPRRTMRPYQIGGGQWINQDVLFHIFAQEPWELDKLIDIITYQKDKTFLSYDKNNIAEANAFPLDDRGMIRDNALMYPDLVSPTGAFYWKKIFIKEMISQETLSPPGLFRGVVRATFEVDCPKI